MTDSAYLAGRLLLAMPGMGDPRFDHAVVALYVHDQHGALGICTGRINRRLTFHELLADVGIDPGVAPDCPVLEGGPVEPQRGFVLHSAEWQGPGTILAPPLGALTASIEVLKAIAAGTGPRRWLVALGYAGWSAGQLEQELVDGAWLVIPPNPRLVFDTPIHQRWQQAAASIGVNPLHLSSQVGHS